MDSTLNHYNKKRNFAKTKEPLGKKGKSQKKLRFVVQHHLARRDHYDFRLEKDGVLKSWAVPKGLSTNPKEKRRAVQVEDHPISYQNFEGTIPKGEYGGGTVMIWDQGYYEIIEDNTDDFKKGTIKITLKGKRLKGTWTFIHYNEKNWLLIKEKDQYINRDLTKFKTSSKSGKTMKEIEKGKKIYKKKQSSNQIEIESVTITSPDKVIWKSPKVTKLDLINYYNKIAPRILPFLENRLISTIRCPNGSEHEIFFKKHLESPRKGIKKILVPGKNGKKEDYYYISNIEGLISEVQMNSYEFHIWGCLAKNINHPDMMVFDLDPDENMKIEKVRQGVKDLKSILDNLGLTSFLKTSGGKGYHVVVPIKSLKNWEKFRTFSKNIATLMATKWPDRYVSNVRKENRRNKIFIDWIRNTKKATSVAPYSIRIRKKATVSMPISWKELDTIKPNEITIAEALKRLKRKDPWENFFDINQ